MKLVVLSQNEKLSESDLLVAVHENGKKLVLTKTNKGLYSIPLVFFFNSGWKFETLSDKELLLLIKELRKKKLFYVSSNKSIYELDKYILLLQKREIVEKEGKFFVKIKKTNRKKTKETSLVNPKLLVEGVEEKE